MLSFKSAFFFFHYLSDGLYCAVYSLMYTFPDLEPVCCSMSGSNCCFLTCIQVFQEAGKVVWYSHLFKNFQQFVVIHTVKGFFIVNKAVDVFLEFSCVFCDPTGFPGGSDGKASACNAGDPGSIPRSGKSPGEGSGSSFQYCCLENPMNRGAW